MKKYALFALPALAVLVVLLIWLINPPPDTSPVSQLPIPKDTVSSESSVESDLNAEPVAAVSLAEQKIADIEEVTTTVLENTQTDEPTELDQTGEIDTSDVALKNYARDKLEPEINTWLVSDHILSKFVRALNALEEGKLVSKYRPLLMPKKAFAAQKQGDKWLIPQGNYDRYTPYITALESIGDTALVQAFDHYYPALKESYEQLGVDKGEFKQVAKRALQQLLDAPDLAISPELSRQSVVFKFKDPELEKLPEAQKLMIRMGPENSLRLKNLIRKTLNRMQ